MVTGYDSTVGTATMTSNGTATIWVNWIGNNAITTGCTTNTIWNYWTTQTTTAPAVSTGVIWSSWANEMTGQQVFQANYNQATQAPRRTVAEQTRIDREQRERFKLEEAARVERAAKAKAAEERAHGLLIEHLTVLQRATLKKHGWFIVQGGKSKKRYVIHAQGIAGNVVELDKADKSTTRYCCHANDNLMPAPDHWLSQKLWIEQCEDEFVKTANKSSDNGREYREAA